MGARRALVHTKYKYKQKQEQKCNHPAGTLHGILVIDHLKGISIDETELQYRISYLCLFLFCPDEVQFVGLSFSRELKCQSLWAVLWECSIKATSIFLADVFPFVFKVASIIYRRRKHNCF